MRDQYDLAIVGGGIGGAALATVMAQAGRSVLLLEQSEVFPDRVRGEWIAPWGVAEVRRLGLYDLLVGAGGHHLDLHVTYDETLSPERAEAMALPLADMAPQVPGPLCLGHPRHCQTLFDAAGEAGAETLRGVQVGAMRAGADPRVTFIRADGVSQTVACRLLVGADGRASAVRDVLGVALHQDKPHHMFAGMLVEGAGGWREKVQAIGTEGDFAFLAFPQGDGRVRLYGSYGLEDRRRFAGPEGPSNFLSAFRVACAPENRHLADATPAGPLLSYFNNDAWTDQPFGEGGVLIGDAAGWNDPIIGQGLSITYRDARMVSDILKASDDWSPEAFAPYAAERAERLRRLRFAASLTATLDAEFGEAARDRRRSHHERALENPMLGAYKLAIMAGPEVPPPDVFTPEFRALALGV